MRSPAEGWHRAVIALGSNLGDRDEELFRAVADLKATEGVTVVASSSVHETTALTEAGYDEAAPRYLNQVVVIDTVWEPRALLQITSEIEARHGRERDDQRYAPRPLDIDIINFGELQHAEPDLEIPHPRAHERIFVLAPWLEVDPEAAIPGRGPVAQLLASLESAR
jgi:2-amino-4-hydroxy-6-hydroxymethyldihydropteridine diphosphokinase